MNSIAQSIGSRRKIRRCAAGDTKDSVHCIREILVIIARGILADAFEPYFGSDPDIAMFAAGVSNSMEIRNEEFVREEALTKLLDRHA